MDGRKVSPSSTDASRQSTEEGGRTLLAGVRSIPSTQRALGARSSGGDPYRLHITRRPDQSDACRQGSENSGRMRLWRMALCPVPRSKGETSSSADTTYRHRDGGGEDLRILMEGFAMFGALVVALEGYGLEVHGFVDPLFACALMDYSTYRPSPIIHPSRALCSSIYCRPAAVLRFVVDTLTGYIDSGRATVLQDLFFHTASHPASFSCHPAQSSIACVDGCKVSNAGERVCGRLRVDNRLQINERRRTLLR
ncbi:hypothetical protein SCHPADRAFT_401924 [Schizopora paradoxa]|uniref:Uncharacterized protein n=1 Tax=Schizopora paradoxa TaxID=27342 RepID=A0A0H2RMF8_9AGAM|nr:hypothetical protein SCHPADRAFT_401924 [Schizopora paradoxa]